MTRAECEDRLIALVEQAEAIFKEYAPDGGRLCMDVLDGRIHITGDRRDRPEEFKRYEEAYHVHATRFEDGELWRTDKWQELDKT